MKVLRHLARIVSILLVVAAGVAQQPILKVDLRRFGFRFKDRVPVTDYTELSFLSEDLILVSVNQRVFRESPEPLDGDRPNSTLLVVDVKSGRVISSRDLPIVKHTNSVHSVAGGRLAILDKSGIQLCTQDLRCNAPMAGPGPVFVSPRGKRIVFGGNGMTTRRVLEVETLRQIASFEDPSQFSEFGSGVIPGDCALLVSRGATSFAVQRPGREDSIIQFDRGGDFKESRFLNDATIAYLDHGSGTAVVSTLDGIQLHRHRLDKVYRTSFITTAVGRRFGIYEHGYTLWNSIVNLLDIEDTRPQNFQRVTVIEVSSGNEVARLEWDPHTDPIRSAVAPQLSPSGRLLARVRNGVLEVLPIN